MYLNIEDFLEKSLKVKPVYLNKEDFLEKSLKVKPAFKVFEIFC